MFRKKLIKILSLSLSLSIVSMGFAFAETNTNTNMDEPVSIQITAVDEALYAKQAEIDKLLFEKYAKELTDKGISVTHTVAVEDYIEVGITPYTPENADVIIKLVGDDGIKVIEGVMAVTLQYNPELNGENVDPSVVMDPVELADDSQIVTITEDISTTAEPEIAKDVKTVSVPVKESKGVSPLVIGAGAVAVLGVGSVILKKKTA